MLNNPCMLPGVRRFVRGSIPLLLKGTRLCPFRRSIDEEEVNK
jgi:hypothetical protein